MRPSTAKLCAIVLAMAGCVLQALPCAASLPPATPCSVADSLMPVCPSDSATTDSLPPTPVPANENSERYEKHVRRARHFWRVITPRRTVLQYAGGIGLISVGVGWMYGPHKVWETDFLIGFVPSYNTGGTKVTLTLKQTYAPFNVQINKLFSYQPLACGLYLNSIFGEEFWTSEPKRYPEHYYGFSTGIRAGINLGQRIKLNIPPMRRRWCREIIFYYEANTCDLYLVSFFKNKDVSFWDILNFSFGLKFTVF